MIYKREREKFEMREISNIMPRIEYVSTVYKNSFNKYEELYNWLYSNFKINEKIIRKNELTYLYNTLKVINKEISSLGKSKDDIRTITKLHQINFKNKKNFELFLEDIKFEYNFLEKSSLEKDSYEYFNRVLSWYKLKPELIEAAIQFMSINKIELKELIFEEINYQQIEFEELNINDYQIEL